MDHVRDDEDLIRLWLHGKSENTRDGYFRDMMLFTEIVDKPLPAVRLADMQAYVDALAHHAPATRARKISSIRSLFSFGHRLGYLPVNLGAMVKPPPVKNVLSERILEEADVDSLIRLEPDARNRLILELLYKSAVRVSELCELRWRDVRRRKGSLQVTVFGKGGRTRVILLPEGVSARLQSFRGDADAGEPLFVSAHGGALHRSQVYRIVRAAAWRCGLRAAVSPHWLRHAHASHALDRGAPTHLVQSTLGHASLATTGRYTHARPDDSSALYVTDHDYQEPEPK